MRIKSNYLTVIAAAAAVMGTSLIGFTERAEATAKGTGGALRRVFAAASSSNEVYRYPRPYYYRRNYYYGGYPNGYDDTYYYGGATPITGVATSTALRISQGLPASPGLSASPAVPELRALPPSPSALTSQSPRCVTKMRFA